jgi:hypothetical protein
LNPRAGIVTWEFDSSTYLCKSRPVRWKATIVTTRRDFLIIRPQL